jgi:hypothetical protein
MAGSDRSDLRQMLQEVVGVIITRASDARCPDTILQCSIFPFTNDRPFI